MQNCVVVGHYKPGIVLLVEPSSADPTDEAVISDLKEKILERHSSFNARLFIHERINGGHQIVIVPRGTLPRTMVSSIESIVNHVFLHFRPQEKGNIR